MVLEKKVAIFDWERGRNSAPREGLENPLNSVNSRSHLTSDLGLVCQRGFQNMSADAKIDNIFSRDMWFPTMWHFDNCRFRQACAASV